MKRLAVILIALLSFFLNGQRESSAVISQDEWGTDVSVNTTDFITKDSPITFCRDMSFMPMSGNAFSGNTTSFSGSIRLTQTGRRINPSTKTTFRLVKAGKVIDGRSPFQRGVSLFQLLPDLFSFNQHLHLMGILRL